MNTRERLMRYEYIKEELVQLRLKYKDLTEELEGRPIVYNDMPTAHSNSSNVENYVINKDYILNNISRKEREILRIESALRILDDEELDIIKARFLNIRPKPIEVIAYDMGMSKSKLFRVTDKAIYKIEKLFNCYMK